MASSELAQLISETRTALRHAQQLYGAGTSTTAPRVSRRRNPVRRVKRKWRRPSSRTTSGLVNSTGAPTKAQERDYARSLFAKHGWNSGQMAPLEQLWNHESGDPSNPSTPWNPRAHNASGASGIAQFMPYTAPYFSQGNENQPWQAQIEQGLNYIHDRYGSPAGAWAQYFHHAHGEGSY